jgi:hypothetical protein
VVGANNRGRSEAGVTTNQTPFFRRLSSANTSRGGSKGPIFAVGHRVFVTCGNAQRGVTLTDSTGDTALGTLADGAEVEILAWQPRGPGGTRYRIRPVAGTVEGWLGATNLRAPVMPEPSPAVVLPVSQGSTRTGRTTSRKVLPSTGLPLKKPAKSAR